jgi:gluconolactonase
MLFSAGFLALSATLYTQFYPAGVRAWTTADVPSQAQVVNQLAATVLDYVPPPLQANATSVGGFYTSTLARLTFILGFLQLFIPPGSTLESLMAKPFHIYDDSFYDIIGTNPTLTLLADGSSTLLFHEAVVWYVPWMLKNGTILTGELFRNPPTDEVFFVQNAGAKAAGTGLTKSSVISKIKLSQAATAAASGLRNQSGNVDIIQVDSSPMVINPNGTVLGYLPVPMLIPDRCYKLQGRYRLHG